MDLDGRGGKMGVSRAVKYIDEIRTGFVNSAYPESRPYIDLPYLRTHPCRLVAILGSRVNFS